MYFSDVNCFSPSDLACKVILNAKVQRPTVCNALEQLLINKDILADAVPKIFAELDKAGVLIKCDEETL